MEVCKSNEDGSVTTQHIIDCIPGKFAIFNFPGIPMNESVLKAAGQYLHFKNAINFLIAQYFEKNDV